VTLEDLRAGVCHEICAPGVVPTLMRVALLALAGLAGCSSQYFPQSPNHVSMSMQDGKLVYVRDGRTFNPGLGGGLVDAVQGNPQAVAAAEQFRSRQITGLTATILGTAAMIGGGIWGAVLAVDNPDRPSNDAIAPIAMVLAGAVAMIAGAGYIASAAPYQWDAINLFNDGADRGFGPPAGTPSLSPPGMTGMTSYAPTASLRMR